MSDTQTTVELTKQQRDVLLRGLRFVKRAIMLDPQDPTPELEASRSQQIQSIEQLTNHLTGATANV